MVKTVKNNKGMSLAELCVAMVVLEIVVMGFAYFFSQSILWAKRARGETLSTSAARAISDNGLALAETGGGDLSGLLGLDADRRGDLNVLLGLESRGVALSEPSTAIVTITLDVDGAKVNPYPDPAAPPARVHYAVSIAGDLDTDTDTDTDKGYLQKIAEENASARKTTYHIFVK